MTSSGTLRVGCYRYDTTRALFEGSVTVAGVDRTEMSTGATLPDVFAAATRGQVDVSEFGLTFYLRTLESDGAVVDEPPFVAVPAFPNRVFRHSCVYVNRASGITSPADLVGRTIGEFGIYGQDSGVWAKGILSDEYGFDPAANRWIVAGLDRPMPPLPFTTLIRPAGVDIDVVTDRSLSDMLVSGEVDAVVSANVPQCVLDGAPQVSRLFEDYPALERDWFRRTGIFPIMHTVVIRRGLLADEPALGPAVYEAFERSKELAAQHYRDARRLYQVPTMLPWVDRLVEEDLALLGADWWPYGIKPNRTALETYLRYHHEQGLSARRWSVDEIFAGS